MPDRLQAMPRFYSSHFSRTASRVSLWFPLLLLLLLPACSLLPTQPALEGFSPEALQQIRKQSTELEQLQKLNTATSAQQRQIQQLRNNLQQFERDVIRNAGTLERQNDWPGAEQLLISAARTLPDSQILKTAQQQLAERRQLREERVRMELAIHQGEQLLKDAEAYQRLQQLQGPGVMNWLELKNFNRKRRASAQALQQHAQRAIQRENRADYALAQRALKIALALYSDDLPLAPEQREIMETSLAQAEQKLRPTRSRRPARTSPTKTVKAPITELQQALDAGDLVSARQYLDEFQQLSPQSAQLNALQQQFQSQLNARVTSAIKIGNELYSQGKTEQALKVWREVAVLAPGNVELQSNIARAKKLLKNLRALSSPPNANP